MSEQNKKYWTSQLIPMKSSNSIQSLNHEQSPVKYTSSTSNINLVQKQRDTRRQLLNDQHQEQLIQQQLFYGQHSRTGRSLSQLPTTSGITHSYSNNSVDNNLSHISSATKNIYYNISDSYQLEQNTKSLDVSADRSSLNYSKNSPRNGSKFNLEGANAYHSYENYVNDRCSKNNKSSEHIIKNSNSEKFNRCRDVDLNIDNTKWLEEKPISVLQLDQPDRAVLKIADQRDKIQKKTFTKWINKYLNKQKTEKISDLFEDLRDGVCLISLLQILSHKDIAKEKGTTRFHALQNVHRCLDFLEDHNIKLVNIRPDEIVDGNPKLTLGLIWIIILNFQISDIVGKDVIARDALMIWANKHLETLAGMIVQDFTHSWKDGKAFLGILHRHIPDKFSWENIKLQSNKQNLQLAFNLAENEFNVTKLLDPEDVDVSSPDERSIITYVSSLYEGLPVLKTYTNQIEKEKEKRGLIQEYSMLFKILTRWLNQSIESMSSKCQLPSGYVELKSLIADLKSFRLEEYAAKIKDKKKLANVYAELQSYYGKKFPQILKADEDIRVIEKLWDKLDITLQNRESQLEHAILRSEKLQRSYESFISNTENLDFSLDSLRNQLEICTKRFSEQNRNKKSIDHDFKQQLSNIEVQLHSKEVELRKNLIDAYKLQEDKYPNSNVLIDELKRLEKTTIGLSVSINSIKTARPNQTLSNLIITEYQQTSETLKKLNLVSPPSSISLDKSHTSNLSTPSQSITVSSASTDSSCNPSRIKSSAHFKSSNHFYELSMINTTPVALGSNGYNSSPIIDSPKSMSQASFLSNISSTNASGSRSKSITMLNKSNMNQDMNSITDTDILDLINDSFTWIRTKQTEVDFIKFKPDLSQIQIDLEFLSKLKQELIQYRSNIETIELLKMNHAETKELTDLINQLNMEYHLLCTTTKSVRSNLDSLNEFIKLVHDELHYINEMEDVELNRDWSQPGKLNASELIKHRKQIESTLSNKKMAYAKIITFAENLIEAKHPAIEDIKAYVSALKTGKTWLKELMTILGTHTSHLQKFDKFMKNYNEIDMELNDMTEQFKNLTSSTAYNLSTWNDSLREDFTNQFNVFMHSFQTLSKLPGHIESLTTAMNNLPSYKLRRLNLKAPYNRTKILTDYCQTEFTILKDEICQVDDNSNPLKWMVLSVDKNRSAEVPSVCFVLNGPDSELADLIDKLKFKYEKLNESIKKFNVKLKKEKVSKLMNDILNDCKTSQLKYVSEANMTSLMQNVQDEIDQIQALCQENDSNKKSHRINSPAKQQDEFTVLIHEFKNFNESLNTIMATAAEINPLPEKNIQQDSDSSKILNQNSIDNLQSKIDQLYETFKLIANEQFILHIQNANNNSTIKKNLSLETQFQQFQQNEFRSFEKELKLAEKNSISTNNSSSNLSSSVTNLQGSEVASSNSSLNPNEDFKSKISHVKSKYQNLIHLSNLYSQSFSNLDSLSKLIDEFISDMCKIEIKLAAQSLIENANIDSTLITKEYESLQEVKSLFKQHENDLMVMKSYYDELKLSMDKVRSRNLEQEKYSLLSIDSARHKKTEERQAEDLVKLDLLIKQLTDRWNHSLHFYRSRRSNLKDCQKAYDDFQSRLKVEKESLKSTTPIDFNTAQTADQNTFLLNEKKQAVEECNQKAAQFVQMAKVLNCQIVEFKSNLTILNEDTLDNESCESIESIYSTNSLPEESDPQQQHSDIKIVNQNLFLHVWNDVNDLNRIYFDQLNQECEESSELTLNDIFLSHFNESFKSELNILSTPLDIEPEFTCTELTDNEMQNYKDFCGSQEWQFQLKSKSQRELGSRSSNSIPYKHKSSDSSSSSSSSLINNHKSAPLESQSFIDKNEMSSIDSELTNFYHSSLISDYRLTLTDLIDLNLIDISNGLIINPLNGHRLTIADAIRIDLLNSDVKELANTFLDTTNTSVKLTVREAIQIQMLNPFRNEILLSQSNSNLRLNIYDARKRNMILKPLTLSEAFIRNLIQPNGFVRNPINNKYYAFETLILSDMEQNKARKNKSLNYDASIQHFVFDFETKHIIDPNDRDKRLLSLTEAVNIGLIIPRTFELNLTTPNVRRVNLYEAFFNGHSLRLSLLLYKPEIENVYIKLSSDLYNNKPDYFSSKTKKSKLSIILSRRDRIGLIEAINLNVIDLKTMTYATLSEQPDLTSLTDAISKHEIIDKELLELLNTPVNNNHTIRDYINDFTLVLEKYLVRDAKRNEYVQFDSYIGKTILSESLARRIKRLITRINVKSYIISLNTATQGITTPNSIQNVTSISNTNIREATDSKKSVCRIIKSQNNKKELKQPPPVSTFYFGDEEEPEDTPPVIKPLTESSISKDSITSVWLSTDTDIVNKKSEHSQVKSQSNEVKMTHSSKTETSATSTLAIESVIDSNTGKSHSIEDAIELNIIDKLTMRYTNSVTGSSMTLDEAFKSGLAMGKFYDKTRDFPNVKPSTVVTQREEKCYKINGIFNPSTNLKVTLEEAIAGGIFNKEKGTFNDPMSGKAMNLNEAVKRGFVYGEYIPQSQVDDEGNKSLKININKEVQRAEVVKPLVSNRVLYEVNEVEEVMFVTLDENYYNKEKLLEEKRFEQVIEDDDYESYDHLTLLDEQSVKKRENCRTGLRKNILERRIPSYCDKQTPETLVINDVRQSVMLDIDGVSHIVNNEVQIDSDLTKPSEIHDSLEGSCSVSQKSESSSSQSSYESHCRKTSNRSVTVIDDQIFNGEYSQMDIVNGTSSDDIQKQNGLGKVLKLDLDKVDDLPKSKCNEVEGKALVDSLRQILEDLNDFEFELARQSPLPADLDTYKAQRVAFNDLKDRFVSKEVLVNNVITQANDFNAHADNEMSKNRNDLVNYSTEAGYRLKTINNEIEKRDITLESGSILLKSLLTDRKKFHDWFTNAQRTLDQILHSYEASSLHDLPALERFENESKTLEIILFSHQEEMPLINQHYKNYSATADYFSKDLKSFCVNLKNTRTNRLSADMTSNLIDLKEQIATDENSLQALYQALNAFRAKLKKRIERNIVFDNSCMKLDLWLNNFEPKLKNELTKSRKLTNETSNSEGQVRKLEDAYKKLQSFHSDILNKRTELDEIKFNMSMVIEQMESTHGPLTRESLEQKANLLVNRFEAVEMNTAQSTEALLKKLTNIRNLKENLDSTSQWLNDLNESSGSLNSCDDRLEAYDRLKAEIQTRKQLLIKSFPRDEATGQLEQLINKIDSLATEIDLKAENQQKLDNILSRIHSEHSKLSEFCKQELRKLNTLQLGPIKDTIKTVEDLEAQVNAIERPKCQNLSSALSDAKYKFWPDVLTDDKLKSVQHSITELENNLNQLAESAQMKMNDLQNIHDYSTKHRTLKDRFEAYLQQTEESIFKFEPIAVDVELIEGQCNQLEDIISDYENKSHDLDELNSFTNLYISLIAKINTQKHPNSLESDESSSSSLENINSSLETSSSSSLLSLGASASKLEADLSQELVRMNQTYEWTGERLDERKKDLSESLEAMKTYLQDIHQAEFRLSEFEKTLKKLFAINDLDSEVKLTTSVSALKKLTNDSVRLMEKNQFHSDVELSKLKGKQHLFDRLTNDTAGVNEVKKQYLDLEDKFKTINEAHQGLNNEIEQFTLNLTVYQNKYSTLQADLESKQSQISELQGDLTQSVIPLNIEQVTVETDIKKLSKMLKDLESDRALLDEINQIGETLLKNATDQSELTDQLRVINSDFDLISNSLEDSAMFKSSLLDSSRELMASHTACVGKVEKLEQRLKEMKENESDLEESEVKRILCELDTLETVMLSECDQDLSLVESHFNTIYELAKDHLTANGLQPNAQLNIQVSPLPHELRTTVQSSADDLKTIKSEFTQLLDQSKAFSALHDDLNSFIQFKREQIKDSNKLSTQLSRLKTDSSAHENFTKELNARLTDIEKLTEFYKNKIGEVEEASDKEIVENQLNEIETEWDELCGESQERKDKISICLEMAEGFNFEHKRVNDRLSKYETDKAALNEDSNDLASLISTQALRYNDLLGSANELSLDELRKLGAELQAACELDMDITESELVSTTERAKKFVTELKNSIEANKTLNETFNKFNSEVKKTSEQIQELSAEVTDASSKCATKCYPLLEAIKEKLVGDIPGHIATCVNISKDLKPHDKDEAVTTQISSLNASYNDLNETIGVKLKDTGDKVTEIQSFQQDLAKMNDKLTNIQDFLAIKETEGKAKAEVIDEASLKAKQDHLDKIKESLASLDEQLCLATQNLAKYLAASAQLNEPTEEPILDQLQKTVQDLSMKSIQLQDLQQKEEDSIKEQSEMLDNLTGKIVKCNEDITKCGKDFDAVVIAQKPIDSPLATKSAINMIISEHVAYEETHLQPIKKDLTAINTESSELFNVDVKKPLELKAIQAVDVNQMTSLELRLEKLNSNYGKLDGKFQERAEHLDMALYKSAKFEDKLDSLNENLTESNKRLEHLNKTLFDFENLDEIDFQRSECAELTEQLIQASDEIDDFKEICEKIMQNCTNPEDRDVIEKRMDNIIYKWNIQTRQIDEKKANLKFLDTHLKELNQSYLTAKDFTSNLNLKFTSNLILNCIEPIVIKCTHENMKAANKDLTDNLDLINDLKLDTNNLLSIYEDFENFQENNKTVDNKLIAHLSKTISSPQLFALVCMLNKPDIEANVHDIDFKYSDYKFQLSKNYDLMCRLQPLSEKFSQTIAQLNQSFSKLDAELEWLKNTNDNETSQKEKETLFEELHSACTQNNTIITNLEGPLASRIVDEVTNSNARCDEFVQDLNENVQQVKDKHANFTTSLTEYVEVFEEQKFKVKELFAEMDDLLEWLDDIDAKFNNVEAISHEPDVIKIQLAEQKTLNNEIASQNSKLKEITELSKTLIRNKCIEDSIEMKEKLNGLQLQSMNLAKLGVSRLSELEQALAIAQSFYDSYRMIETWFDEIKEDLVNIEQQHSKESLGEPKEAVKLELVLLKQLDRSLQEKKADFETMNKNGSALARLCNKNNGILSLPGTNTDCQSATQLKESIQYSNERYDKFKSLVTKRKEELESLLWKSAEFTEKLDNLTSSLHGVVETCEYAEPISAHPDKLRLQLDDIRTIQADLDKRKEALDDLRDQAINDSIENKQFLSKHSDMLTASNTSEQLQINDDNIQKRINELDELWYQLKDLAESRTSQLDEALRVAETFWADFHSFTDIIGDLEDRLKHIENETVAMDPDSVIEQQQHQEEIVREIDENEGNVNEFRETGMRLLELCGQYDHSEVEKTIEELDTAWSRIKQLVRDREIELQHTFGKACEFQQELIEILEWISLQQEKFINLDSSFTSNDSKTIRFQINLLKEFKEQIDPEQLKIQLLNQKFNDLKMNTRTNQSFDVLASLQEPLNSANKEWKRLQNGIVERMTSLQNALLDMGQFNEALDEMLKWLERTEHSLDEIHNNNMNENELITSNQFVSSTDIQISKLKVLSNDIKAQEQSVEKLKETGKNLIRNETTGKQSLQEIKHRVQLLVDNWENLLLKLQEKQSTLNSRLSESNSFQCELQDALTWLADIETHLHNNKPTGGLPETAREQLEKFLQVYGQVEANEEVINGLIETGQMLMDKNKLCQQQQVNTSQSLNESISTLSTRWTHAKRKASERKEKLESACRDATEFNTNLQSFIAWLTDTEKNLNMNRPVSKVLEAINVQIGEHQVLQKNITEHRAEMVALDTLGYQLKYYSQKQDVILIKNVLISVQNRWEKIVSRSAERTRDLERGYKESKVFNDNWSELGDWLNENLSTLSREQEVSVGNNPVKIRQQIGKHKEFHRLLSQKQPNYDLTVKLGRKLIDKSDGEQKDRPQLQEMLNDIKNKWQTICFQSAERQKHLEDALLCSGQFRDALQSLLEWLSRVEPTLAENCLLNGDLESVLALIEDNQQFQQQLQYKADQVRVVRKAASELILTSSLSDGIPNEDSVNLQEQLNEMNDLWTKVDELSNDRTQRLDTALTLAKEFNAQVRSRLEWLSTAEQVLKFSPSIPIDNEHEIIEQIEQHQNFVRDFKDQETLVQQCLTLGKELLDTCTPEAIVNLKHSIAVVQSRFDEINQLSENKCKRLSDALEMCKENENLLGELLVWLQGAEATLTALEHTKIVNNLEQIEQLLADHQEFETEMQSRQSKVERITKSSLVRDLNDTHYLAPNDSRKKSTSVKSLNKISQNNGWRTPEPKIKNPRVNMLFNRWRKVWLLAMDRQRKLKEAMDRQREMERLKNFNFDDWRRRYMNWHKDNRARITDFFRRQDRDHDGKISREEFIDGILSSNFPSSRLELEAVADKFDLDKDGFIDYKEFLATLKPTSNTEPNFERIRDEVQRQVSLCKCSKRYHVLQISDRQYRFGDSQKLRLVRILQSTVMVRVGGGWMALDEFLVKNDPCRAKGRTNFDLRENLLLRETTHQNPMNGIQRPKSPSRFNTASQNPKNTTTSRSGASSSSANYSSKRTPRSSLSQSNEVLILAATSMPSGAESQSGSLGASISDLSSEATSEFSDNYSLNPSNLNSLNSKSITTSKSGTSTPTKNGSRLPVFKKSPK